MKYHYCCCCHNGHCITGNEQNRMHLKNCSSKNKKKKKKLTGPVIAKKTMFITGMHCEHCVQSVTDSLNRIDGVSARVDLNKSCAEISLDREIGEDILICAVEKAGFLVESIQS